MKKILELFRRYDLKKGVLLVLLAWLSFSSMYAVSKLIGDQTTVSTMVFFRNILGLAFVLPWMIKDWPKSLEIKNTKITLTRSIMGLLSIFFIFLSLQKISLVNTTLLNNTAPFFIPFILWFWMRTHPDVKLWPAVLIGFLGVVFIMQPEEKIFNLGAAYGLLSGICLAIAMVANKQTFRQETLYSFLFYFFAIGLVITTPFAIANWKIEDGLTLLGLFSIGLFAAVGQICLFYGLKFGKAHQLAPFAYAAVLFSLIYEWLLWRVLPEPIAYLGMFLIIGAGIWITLMGHHSKDLHH